MGVYLMLINVSECCRVFYRFLLAPVCGQETGSFFCVLYNPAVSVYLNPPKNGLNLCPGAMIFGTAIFKAESEQSSYVFSDSVSCFITYKRYLCCFLSVCIVTADSAHLLFCHFKCVLFSSLALLLPPRR